MSAPFDERTRAPSSSGQGCPGRIRNVPGSPPTGTRRSVLRYPRMPRVPEVPPSRKFPASWPSRSSLQRCPPRGMVLRFG